MLCIREGRFFWFFFDIHTFLNMKYEHTNVHIIFAFSQNVRLFRTFTFDFVFLSFSSASVFPFMKGMKQKMKYERKKEIWNWKYQKKVNKRDYKRVEKLETRKFR